MLSVPRADDWAGHRQEAEAGERALPNVGRVALWTEDEIRTMADYLAAAYRAARGRRNGSAHKGRNHERIVARYLSRSISRRGF